MAGMDLNPPSIYYTAVIIFKGAGVQHSNYTLFLKKMLWLMDKSVGISMAIQSKKKISWERGAQ